MEKTVVIVSQVQGQVWMRDVYGNLHALQVGMEIPADAVVVTDAGAQVTLSGDEGIDFQVTEGQTITLAENFFQDSESSASAMTDSAVQDAQSLIAALNAKDVDIFDELDPTEAVLTGDAGAGSSYVTLANVVENTSAMSLQYAVGAAAQLGDNAKVGAFVAGDYQLGGGSVVNPTNPPSIYIVPRADQDKSSGHYSWVEGEYGSAQGEVIITAPEGLAKVTFNGVEIPLAMDDPSLPMVIELEHGTVYILGIQPWHEGDDMYNLGFAFIDDNELRDHSNGPVIDEYVIEVTDKAGNSTSDVLKVEILESVAVPNLVLMSDDTVVVEDEDERVNEEDKELVSLVHSHSSEETIWLGSGGDLDFSGSELSSHFKNVDVLDLTLEGAAHTISYLGVDDVLDMSGGKDILTILADGDDRIGFDTKDAWTLNAEKSASGDFNVYEGLSQTGELVEVRISKGFEGLSGLVESEAVVPADARLARAPQPSMDMEMQQMLALQMIDQGKNSMEHA